VNPETFPLTYLRNFEKPLSHLRENGTVATIALKKIPAYRVTLAEKIYIRFNYQNFKSMNTRALVLASRFALVLVV
jgi:ethanolamine transporter EutH